MTSPGTPLPTRRPVWSLTQPCKRRVSATSFLRGIRGTEELRYLPEIPQQGRGPWGSRRLHSGTRLPSARPPTATCPSSPLAASGAFRPPSGQPSLRLECFTLEGQRSPGVLLFLLASKRLDFGCHAGLCPVPLLPRRRRLRELNTRDTKTGQTGRSQRRGPRGAFRRGRGGAHEPPRHEPPGTYRPPSGRLPCVEMKKETLNRAWSREGPRRKPPHPSTVLVHQEQDDDLDRSNS